MLKVLFTILLFAFVVFPQSQIQTKCYGARGYQSITLQRDNIINTIACPSGYSLFTSPVIGRFDYEDSFTYGRGLDLSGSFNNTTDLNPLAYFDYYIDTQKSGANIYQGFSNSITYQAQTVSSNSALIGFNNSASLQSNVDIHDAQALVSGLLVGNGRVGSNANSGFFNTRILSPATAQDVSNIVVSGTANTTLRSWQSIWIKQPNLTSATTSDFRSAIRIDDVSGTPVFLLSLDGTNLNMTLSTPASSVETCRTGSIKADANFLYVCTTTNNWKRATLNAF